MNVLEKYVSICGQEIWTKHITANINNNNPTIIMLHDALGSIEQWKSFPSKLAEKTGCNILLYDRKGHGKSSKRYKPLTRIFFADEALSTLPQVIAKYDIKHFIVYGHSDGGTIALVFGSNKHMPKPLGIIVESSHVLNEETTIEGIKNTLTNTSEILRKLKKYHGDKTETLFSDWSNLWLSERMKDWNITSKLMKIDVPTMVIQGTNDEYGTLRQVSETLNNIQVPCKELIIDNCGHFPHKEYPEIVISEIDSFIKTINIKQIM